MTTWHVMIPSENESDSTHSHDVSEGGGLRMCEESPTVCVSVYGFYHLAVAERRWLPSSASAGRQLLLKAVNRVWTELMHSKRQMLEDIFKVSLPCNDRGHVDIATARPALEELALKSWQNHLGE